MTAPRPRAYWLTEEFYPPQIGGVELMASYLSQGLAARQIDTHVITRQPDPPCAARELIGAVHVRRIRPGGLFKGRGWLAIPLLATYLLRLSALLLLEFASYDVIFVSGMKIIPLAAVPIAKLLGKRCYVRVESTFEIQEPISSESLASMQGPAARLTYRAVARLQRTILGWADRVIAISGEVEQQLRARGYPDAQIARIPNAVDLERFRPVTATEKTTLRARHAIPADKTVMLFAGRLSRAKGVLMLIDALPELLSRWPDLHLLIVGTGKGSFDDCEAEFIERMRARRLEAATQMAGPSDHVHEYLQSADICVFPSEYEGFGLGIIEALGCGIPLAVTPVGVARDLIHDGENGFLFPVNDRAAMTSAIESMLHQRNRWPQIGSSARTAVAPFALSAIVEQYAALCRV